MSKELKAVEENVWVTLKNLQRYKTQSDAQLDKKITEINGKIEQNTARVFNSQKTELNKADADVIKEYFAAHSDVHPRKGDVFLITTFVEGKTFEQSSYTYGDADWEAITGNVDAEKVILRKNIKMAGAYTQVGNLTKTQTGTADFSVKGKSVAAALEEIFSKKLQPKITAQPAVSGFSLTGAKAVEVGTKVDNAQFGTAKLSAGAYEFGPATGVTATTYKVDRIALPATFNKENVAAAANGTDNNEGHGFTIGDGEEANTVKSLKYKVTVSHSEGVVANDNLGGASKPEVKIVAGNKVQETAAYTGFRSFFYGATQDKPEVNSAYVRKLTNSNAPYSAKTLTINVAKGTQRVAIACIAGKTGVTKVINETALNADVTGTFVKSTVQVEGANGYTAKEYNIWTFEPAEAYGQAAVLKVTLG